LILTIKSVAWTVTSLPINWQELHNQWELFHAIHSWVSVLGLALLLGGALISRDNSAVVQR